MLGFPETEEQMLKLKSHGIEFDRIIFLNDTNEDEPGADIKARVADSDDLYDWEWEAENA